MECRHGGVCVEISYDIGILEMVALDALTHCTRQSMSISCSTIQNVDRSRTCSDLDSSCLCVLSESSVSVTASARDLGTAKDACAPTGSWHKKQQICYSVGTRTVPETRCAPKKPQERQRRA